MRYLRFGLLGLLALGAVVGGHTTEVKAASFSDSLQTGSLDPAKWESRMEAFGSVDPQLDGVHMSILPLTYAELFVTGVTLECTVIGDYDTSIDFQLVDWPTAGEMQIGLIQDFAPMMRGVSSGGEQRYVAVINGNVGAAATVDVAGSLRLARTGTVVTAYYWDTSSGWTALQSADDPVFANRTYIRFELWGHWATTGAEVVWRNFSITADTLNCPDDTTPFTPALAVTGDNVAANDPSTVPTGETCPIGLPCKVGVRLQIPSGQAMFNSGAPRDMPTNRAFEVTSGLDVPVGTVVGQLNVSVASDLGWRDTCDTQLDVSLPLINATIPVSFGGGPDGTGAESDRERSDVWPIQSNWQPQLQYWLNQGAEIWARYQAVWNDVGGGGSGPTIVYNWVYLKTTEQGWVSVAWPNGMGFPNWWDFCTPLDGTWNFLGETQDSSQTLLRCVVEGTHDFQVPYVSEWTSETVTVTDSLTCPLAAFTDDDGDGIENGIDGRYVSSSFVDESQTYSHDFTDQHLGGTTYGNIVTRGAVQLQVLDEADPRGVRLKAEGSGQAAEVETCGGTLMYVEGGNQVVVTCGSTEIIVAQGEPVIVVLGTMVAEVPAGSSVAVTETAPNTFSVESLNQSWEPIVVGGVELEPGEAAAVTDADEDSYADAADNCPNTSNPTQTNTDAANEAAGFLFASAPLPGDSQGDACDEDDDNDGFSDADERIIFGVGVGSDEELTPCRTDTVDDPWPADTFGSGGLPDRLVDGQDLVAFLPGLSKGLGQPGYSARLDIFQPGTVIDGQDLVAMLPALFKACTPP
jgi:hypothetical protein